MAKAARAVLKRRPTFPALVKRYRDELARSLQAADHMARHQALQKTISPYALERLERFFVKIPLDSIDTRTTTRYAMRRLEAGEDRDVVDDELRGLSRLLIFAVERGWLERHPAIHFVPRPRPATTGYGLQPRRWFRQGPTAPAPQQDIEPDRRPLTREDVDLYLEKRPHARVLPRAQLARHLIRYYELTDSPSTVAGQLREWNIPPNVKPRGRAAHRSR